MLQEIEKALPDTEIYINSILPVQSKVIEENSDYGNIPEFNERLARLCEEEGAVFIDNTNLVKDEYYTADGIHMSPDYYPGWVDHMADGIHMSPDYYPGWVDHMAEVAKL